MTNYARYLNDFTAFYWLHVIEEIFGNFWKFLSLSTPNISQVIGDGTSVNCVTGEDGVWSLTTWQLYATSWVGTINLQEGERTLWTLRNSEARSVDIVEEPVIVLDIKDIQKIRASKDFIYISLSTIYLAIYCLSDQSSDSTMHCFTWLSCC